MPLGGVLGVAFGLHFSPPQPGSLACCHRNGAPLVADEGLGIFTSPRASQSPSMALRQKQLHRPQYWQVLWGTLEKVFSKGLSFQ